MRLGVNIDHVATIREARGTNYPDPVEAALLAESAGADGITAHIRIDRRHINERDIRILREVVKTHLNVEASLDSEIQNFLLEVKPDWVCLVPEREEELTTEGGLNLKAVSKELEKDLADLAKLTDSEDFDKDEVQKKIDEILEKVVSDSGGED